MAPRACQAYDRSMAGITSKQERFPGLIMCACFTYFTSIQRLVFSLMASNCNLARCLSTPAFALTNGAEQFNWLSVPEPWGRRRRSVWTRMGIYFLSERALWCVCGEGQEGGGVMQSFIMKTRRRHRWRHWLCLISKNTVVNCVRAPPSSGANNNTVLTTVITSVANSHVTHMEPRTPLCVSPHTSYMRWK